MRFHLAEAVHEGLAIAVNLHLCAPHTIERLHRRLQDLQACRIRNREILHELPPPPLCLG